MGHSGFEDVLDLLRLGGRSVESQVTKSLLFSTGKQLEGIW